MIKLSECGYPKRRLWLALKGVATTLMDLVFDIANHKTILAPCDRCGIHEAFTVSLKSTNTIRKYHCLQCGNEIEVENDLSPFGL